jgi:hypothetical protein
MRVPAPAAGPRRRQLGSLRMPVHQRRRRHYNEGTQWRQRVGAASKQGEIHFREGRRLDSHEPSLPPWAFLCPLPRHRSGMLATSPFRWAPLRSLGGRLLHGAEPWLPRLPPGPGTPASPFRPRSVPGSRFAPRWASATGSAPPPVSDSEGGPCPLQRARFV